MGKYKCLILGSTAIFTRNYNALKKYEDQIEIIGFIPVYYANYNIENLKIIKEEEIKNINYDYVILVYDQTSDLNKKNIINKAINNGVTKDKMILYQVLNHYNFDFQLYEKILKKTPTIFANSCWGLLTHDYLCIEYKTPFVNLSINEYDYIKFLKNPQNYLDKELEYYEDGYNSEQDFYYPICKLNDILIHFRHYRNFDEANYEWNKRKKRINMDNLFVMMQTEKYELAEEFVKLPYKNKICFVPFECNLPNVVSLKILDDINLEFWNKVICLSTGEIPLYDPYKLIAENKYVSNIN